MSQWRAALRAAADAGISCPDDLAVIGSDNSFAGSVAFPSLTTLAIDAEGLGDPLAPTVVAALGLREAEELPAIDDAIRLVVRQST